MKQDRINLDYVEDILESVKSIEKFVEGYSYQDFINDEKTYEAIIRKFSIIGEAANKLSPDFRTKYNHIPWRDIISMRYKIIHDYFGIDLATIWDTVEDLHVFKHSMEGILIDLQEEE